jgi:very-short-patch-repair endonuclease
MRRRIFPYNPYLKTLARKHRNNSTQAEIRLWLELKGDQLLGYDFHRQKAIDNYILDFFCHELLLGIEVDGVTHQSQEVQKKDRVKERRMADFGITILRFTDDQVMANMDFVLATIRDWVTSHTPNPSQEGNTPLAPL